MDFWLILLSLAVSSLILLYFYIQRKYSFWSSQGIRGPSPSLLSFGTVGKLFADDPYTIDRTFREKYGKIHGNFRGLKPVLTVAEPELVKQVMIKDFHLFVDQQEFQFTHPIANRIIFFQDNAKDWKRIRTITSPCFSSAKLRAMFGQMDRSVQQLIQHLDLQIGDQQGKCVIKDVKQVMIGFALDVLASNIFGVETNLNQEPNNAFMSNALKLTEISALKVVAIQTFPKWLCKRLGIRQPLNNEAWNFFESLAREILRQRRSNETGTKRNDLIDILLSAQVDQQELDSSSYTQLDSSLDQQEQKKSSNLSSKTSLKATLSEEEIIAQAIGFLIGGFDSVSSTLAGCVYELSLNPSVQERLFSELDKDLSNFAHASTEYNEAVMQHEYLDAVLKETLRKYPPFVRVGRRFGGSSKLGYEINGVVLRQNQLVEFPTLSLHYNPEYFPEPDRFDPDRFMNDQSACVAQHNPYSYLPFAHGPRNCIGMRFATQELKLCLAAICRNFRFVPTEATPKDRIAFLPYKIILALKQFELKVVRR